MAIVMKMNWKEIKPADYENARRLVQWETNPARGGIFHVAWFTKDGLNVLDVWESEADLNNFVQNRLMPTIRNQMKITSEPKIEVLPAHTYFKPLTPKDCETYDAASHSFIV